MIGYRAAGLAGTSPTTFTARFVRVEMVAAGFLVFLMWTFVGGYLLCSPRVDLQCLQVSQTCRVDAVYFGVVHTSDVFDLRGASGPAHQVGTDKRTRFLGVPLEGGGVRRLGQFGTITPLVTDGVNLAVRGQRDVDASNPGLYQLVCLALGIVTGIAFLAAFARERIAITLQHRGSRIYVTLRRAARATRTLDFATDELTRFVARLTVRRSNQGMIRSERVYCTLQAELPHEAEEILAPMPDRPELHELTAQLNRYLGASSGHAHHSS